MAINFASSSPQEPNWPELGVPGELSFSRTWNEKKRVIQFRNPSLSLKLRDLYRGVLVLGSTGSGKTSTTGTELAKAYLRAEMGGLVLCAKQDECDRWVELAKKTGRESDLRIVGRDPKMTLNILAPKSGLSIEQRLQLLIEASNLLIRSRSNQDPFWERMTEQLLRNALIALESLGSSDLSLLLEIIQTFPQDGSEAVTTRSSGLIREAFDKLNTINPDEAQRFNSFVFQEWPFLAEKTRSIVLSSTSALLDRLTRAPLKDLFFSTGNASATAAFGGAIVIVDVPSLEEPVTGRIANMMWKRLFQLKAQKRRNPIRPCFLWADECQYFLTKEDTVFQSTARSYMVVTTLLTQSLSALTEALGSRVAIDSLVQNLQTIVIHGSSDESTLRWMRSLKIDHRHESELPRKFGERWIFSGGHLYAASRLKNLFRKRADDK